MEAHDDLAKKSIRRSLVEKNAEDLGPKLHIPRGNYKSDKDEWKHINGVDFLDEVAAGVDADDEGVWEDHDAEAA